MTQKEMGDEATTRANLLIDYDLIINIRMHLVDMWLQGYGAAMSEARKIIAKPPTDSK